MSSYRVYSGSKKALILPIMSDGFVEINYDKHIPLGSDVSSGSSGIGAENTVDNDDSKYGLWANKSSFTMEAIITPYDVNGFGYLLGRDVLEGDGTRTVSNSVSAERLGLPFNNKYYSAPANPVVNSSSSNLYFSNSKIATLAAAINTSATTIKLSNTEDIMSDSIIKIHNADYKYSEDMKVSSVKQRNGGTSEIIVTRGANGTEARSHGINSLVTGDNRLNHKMVIFHNETCQFYLKNLTRGNMNQPAEYKIGAILKGLDIRGNEVTVTMESNNPVISPSKENYGSPIPQTEGAKKVFGEPIYLSGEDRVRYNRKITSNSSPYIYGTKGWTDANAVNTGTTSLSFSESSSKVATIAMVSGGNNFPSIPTGLIQIKGSGNNDGFYTLTGGGGTNTLTVDTNIWYQTNSLPLFASETMSSGNLLIYHTPETDTSFLALANGNYPRVSSSGTDFTDYFYKGMNIYYTPKYADPTINGESHYLTSDTLPRITPRKLGYVAEVKVPASGGIANTVNKTGLLNIGLCRLIKPIRTVTETTMYVDDTSSLSVGQKVNLMGEIRTITSILGNKVTAPRGNSPKTTCTNPFSINNGGVGSANYLVKPSEEEDFSRTIYSYELNNYFHTLKITTGPDGDSLSNSDGKGMHLLTDTWMEANYVLRPFHLSLGYDEAASRLNITVDNNPVESLTFSETKMRMDIIRAEGATSRVKLYTEHNFKQSEIDADSAWVRIENTTNYNGIWKVKTIVGVSEFLIQNINSHLSDGESGGYIIDVSIRETNPIVDFEFGATNCYLGSNGEDFLPLRRKTQFMGEMHEFSITKDYRDRFNTIDTLLPNYRNTLLYFRFEEANL